MQSRTIILFVGIALFIGPLTSRPSLTTVLGNYPDTWLPLGTGTMVPTTKETTLKRTLIASGMLVSCALLKNFRELDPANLGEQ